MERTDRSCTVLSRLDVWRVTGFTSYAFTAIHSRAYLSDLLERYRRDREPVNPRWIKETYVPELVSRKYLTTKTTDIPFEVITTTRYLEIAFATQFWPWPVGVALKCHLVDHGPVW